MKLAFYAPMKPPDDPVPSGDRTMGRGILSALEYAGVEVELASRLRSRDGAGDAAEQTRIMETVKTEASRLIKTGRAAGWQGWLTYHNYYKAPDLLGPGVARALGIPYVQIESTRARKRLFGPWAAFARCAEDAAHSAQAIFHFTRHDAEALLRDAPPGQHILHLHPFLDRDELPRPSALSGPMLAVGMMRQGDKLASYGLIAAALQRLQPGWRLDIAGDGPARPQVERLMAPFGDAVRFLGALDGMALQAAYSDAALLIWPGVNEAFGMVYLEAQAVGLPVVAQDRPGVRDVLAPGTYPVPKGGAPGLAARLRHLLSNTKARHDAGAEAARHITRHHLRPVAARTLLDGLHRAGVAP